MFISFTFLVAQPSLERKIAEMIMVGFSGTTVPESLKVDLSSRGLGGVLLFAANITNPFQAQELNAHLKSFSQGLLLVAVDQEGGKVARLSASNGFSATPTAYRLGTILNREDSTRTSAAMMAGWLQQSGFTINFAPVADVNVNPLSPAIGKNERSYSKDPDSVSRHIGWFIDEFHKKKIITTLKHFPGHGSAATDSHLGFTDISSTWTSKELIPFRSAIDRGIADLIMIGHLYNSSIDSLYPASLSFKTVSTLLRDSLHYDGVVISDELFMNAISANYAFDDALELCVKSGTDILLFAKSIYNNNSLPAYVINLISQKVKSGAIAESMIDSAYQRIQRLKKRILTNAAFASVKIPSESMLFANYPNPFNGGTVIRYKLHLSENVSLKIYDVLGQEVVNVVREEQQAGDYSVIFNATNLSSGIYFYRLKAGNFSSVKKMLLVK
jgi:beta-N-acetylhexosaminidase